MIAIIGGIESIVKIKMMPSKGKTEQTEREKEDVADAQPMKETTVGGLDATGFEAYYRKQQRAMEAENYWSEVGANSGLFGGYNALSDMNDCDISININGCGYNVAQILGKKHQQDPSFPEVVFFSAVGQDAMGRSAVNELQTVGVDASKVKLEEEGTAVRVEIHNMMGDLQFMRKHDGALYDVTPEYIDENEDILQKAEIIFMDGCLPTETIMHISEKFGSKKIYFDPGSVSGAGRFSDAECRVYGVMPGRRESEIMTGLTVLGLDQLMEAGMKFEEFGVKHTIITLKGGGLYYKEGIDSGIVTPKKVLSFADTSGAGDVVSAEILASVAMDKTLKEAAEAAIAAADEYLSAVSDDSVQTQLRNKGML